jgi:DNA repair exonuclease SbcCD ATPase subunit
MITFKKIRWKNFLSTGQHFTEIDFQKNQTNLIVGTNGAGKSTVLDALTFVLVQSSIS